MSIQVVVGATEPMYRLGLRTACEAAGLTVRGEVDARSTLLDRSALEPSVVVTEPDLLAPDVAGAVWEASARHRVLLVDGPRLDKPRALRAGASGFVPRSVDPAVLRRAVEAAEAGDLVLPAADGRACLPPGSGPRLTHREADVLRSLAEGGSTRDCAQSLHLSVTTVKTHLRAVNTKLGTTSRTAATAKAVTLGLLG